LSIEVVEKFDAAKAIFRTPKPTSVIFRVRVQPRANKNSVGGEWEGALKVSAVPFVGGMFERADWRC
jgi:hypothetical protein